MRLRQEPRLSLGRNGRTGLAGAVDGFRVRGELFGFRRDKIGADLMGEIVVGTPEFGQLA